MRKSSFLLILALGIAVSAALVFISSLRHPRPALTHEVGPVLDPSVAAFFAMAEAGQIQAALLSLAKLTDQLSKSDADALLRWSVGTRPAKVGPEAWYAVVNDVWNVLRRQSNREADLIPALLTFFRSPATPYVLRDYSVQHIGAFLREDFDSLGAAQRSAALSLLKEAALMRDHAFAGTALYALKSVLPKLSNEMAAVKEELAQAALALLADPVANNLARISAFQIVIETADSRGAVHARRIAADVGSAPMLRAPAIAYLGRFGTPEDAALLRSIREGCSDLRLIGALNPALARLTDPTPASK